MAGQDARLYRDSDQMEPIAPSFLPFEPPLRVLLTRMYFQANSNPVGRGFVHPAPEKHLFSRKIEFPRELFQIPFRRNGNFDF